MNYPQKGNPLDNTLDKALLRLYALGWRAAIPGLKRNGRLAEGFAQRTQADAPKEPVDIWIQAASAGEAYLATSLVAALRPALPLRVHVTSNTRQGMDIIAGAQAELGVSYPALGLTCSYFPFDHPKIMQRAVSILQPKVMVLLETEIWPGLLLALKRQGTRILMVNARMTAKSFTHYSLRPTLFSALAPDKIWAISHADSRRFGRLFGQGRVSRMQNMKFDRVETGKDHRGLANPLGELLPADGEILVLGSIRTAEEAAVGNLIGKILTHRPGAVIALFPRHLARLEHWQHFLAKNRIPWIPRSAAKGTATAGTVLLWDTFGELVWAYARARAAFVGGSLAPMGGQNFLEPLACGVRPVIGPHWDNFAWVGRDIIATGLVRQVAHWQAAAERLVADLTRPARPDWVRARCQTYINRKKGGTAFAAAAIRACLMASHERNPNRPRHHSGPL